MRKHPIWLSAFVTITIVLVGRPGIAQVQGPEISAAPVGDDEPLKTIEEFSGQWPRVDGFQPYLLDHDQGRIWFVIADWNREFLLSWGLGTGLGSNPVGLDRGQLGTQFVCQFRRVGRKVFLVARNLDYRATSDNLVEQRAVQDSFAESILWGGQVAAATGSVALVDVTGLLTSDLHGVANRLKSTEQGDYTLDVNRSGLHFDRCKSFPQNTELESTLTFASQQPGPLVSQVAPSPGNITLRQHVSLVQLPDEGYVPREHHPRCPSMFIRFSDYGAPIDATLEKRWILRHRLVKQNPDAVLSPAVEPIVYYVDPAAPPLIRDALIEGAGWWNEAFESAGFQDAFQVRVLPDDVDPMDIRYNVIQWVHRSTRGWSYGGSVIDPRTGEIIKGHVSLGSLRVRQDRMIFDALPQARTAMGAACGLAGVAEESTLARLDEHLDPVQVALARIRQLSAHEVGHTIGLVHNFAGSTWDDRASVMDYPAPRIRITGQQNLDLSDAYAVGIGSWDKWSIQYAYRQFANPQEEKQQLNALVQSAIELNMSFVSDADARPAGAAHPDGSLWDNGSDPVAELQHVMEVRRIALQQLQPEDLKPDEPQSNLEQLFVPVYLHHRFQVDATAKMIGGVRYSSEMAGNPAPMVVVSDSRQKQALQALLETLNPRVLVIRDDLWKLMTPGDAGHRENERFRGNTRPVFDRETAARVAADLTLGNLLQPERVSRMAMVVGNPTALDARRLTDELINYCWQGGNPEPRVLDVSRIVRQSLTDHLLQLATHPDASINARSAALFGIDRVRQILNEQKKSVNTDDRWFAEMMLTQLDQFASRPYPTIELPQSPWVPPGSPIGNQLDP